KHVPMKILYCGDIVGRAGRDVVKKRVPELRREHNLDAVIVNVDNAAGGFGISGEALRDLKGSGIDVMPAGDHVFDQKDAPSLLVGSHTHVPTADARILAGGTGYMTDAGMCGDYNNTVIGFEPSGPMQNFLLKYRKVRMEPGSGPGTLCGVIVELDKKGLTKT